MSNISTAIKSIQNIMRKDAGVDGDAQRIAQLGWILFLKVFDAWEEEQEEMAIVDDETYTSIVPERYRWKNWAADDEKFTGEELIDFINNQLFPALKTLTFIDENDPKYIVRSVMEDSFNYMKSSSLLKDVIDKINQSIDFSKQEERHLFNDIYEKILKDLQSAGNAGEFYTPRPVTKFIVEMVNPAIGEKILDPACGTGGFLINALEHIRVNHPKMSVKDREQLQRSIRGVEKKQLPHLLATTNLILHGIELPAIEHGNLLIDGTNDITPRQQVDVVITNPPFGGQEEDGIESSFPTDVQTRETADLFLFLILEMLKPTGRCGLVLPDGFLFGDGVTARIKEKLLNECNLHTIIKLPNGVFAPYTGIKTNLLFFEKGTPTKDIWFFEHPYPKGYKSYSKTRPLTYKEFDREKAWWNNRTEGENSWKIDIRSIIETANNQAETHRQKSIKAKSQAGKTKLQISDQRETLKNTKDKKTIDALKKNIKKLEQQLKKQEQTANTEKQTADKIYYAAYNLDFKNPIQEVEEVLPSSSELIERLEQSLTRSDKVLKELKKVL